MSVTYSGSALNHPSQVNHGTEKGVLSEQSEQIQNAIVALRNNATPSDAGLPVQIYLNMANGYAVEGMLEVESVSRIREPLTISFLLTHWAEAILHIFRVRILADDTIEVDFSQNPPDQNRA